MNQTQVETRYRVLTSVIENTYRMNAVRREDMSGLEIGVVIHEDLTLWGTIPNTDDREELVRFADELCAQAKREASRQA